MKTLQKALHNCRLIILVALSLMPSTVHAWTPTSNDVVDTDSSGIKGNSVSVRPEISADGRYVAFISFSTDLVIPNTLSGNAHAYRKDTATGEVVILDTDSNGAPEQQGLLESRPIKLSSDGTKAVFSTYSALVPDDNNGSTDVYVKDTQSGITTRASVGELSQEPNSDVSRYSITGDGSKVFFASYATNLVSGETTYKNRIYMRDLETNTTSLIPINTQGVLNLGSASVDGRYLTYTDSYPTPCGTGCTTTYTDIFVLDRQSNTAQIANASTNNTRANNNGGENEAISSNGRYISFRSNADNLVLADTNQAWDIFVRDMAAGTTELVSVSSGSQQANSSSYSSRISDDGRYVTFDSSATNLAPNPQSSDQTALYIRDRLNNRTERATPDNAVGVFGQAISADGSYFVLAAAFNPNPSNSWTIYRKSINSVLTPITYNTPTGNGVQVSLPPIDLNFSQVITPGNTSVNASLSSTQPPTGFKLGNPPTYYHISTTATFTGSVQVCINYDESSINGPESNLKLMHYETGVGWVNTTSSLDTTNNIICGTVTSFSDFAVMTPPTISDLVATVQQMNLQQGIQNSLDSKLQNAQNALDAQRNNNISQAVSSLDAFKNEVSAQRGVKLTNSQADELTGWADNLIKLTLNGTDQTYTVQ